MGIRGKKVAAIIAAAGTGARMGGNITKQKIVIGGMSIIRRTVLAFENCDSVDEIILAVKEDEREYMKNELYGISKLTKIVTGGKTRAESVKNAFMSVSEDIDIVAIHDGARCLVTDELITKVIDAAEKYGAATAVGTVYDTIKQIDTDGFIKSTLDRSSLRFAGTPQVFDRKIYARALDRINLTEALTDDNMLVEALGEPVYAVEMGRENIKVTTPFDLELAELILNKRGELL